MLVLVAALLGTAGPAFAEKIDLGQLSRHKVHEWCGGQGGTYGTGAGKDAVGAYGCTGTSGGCSIDCNQAGNCTGTCPSQMQPGTARSWFPQAETGAVMEPRAPVPQGVVSPPVGHPAVAK